MGLIGLAVPLLAQHVTGECQVEDWAACVAQAEAGDAQAQYSIGGMYDAGRGVTQDDTEAERWYRLAAAQGNAGAQYELGWRYANGVGVDKDDEEAVGWYRRAAAQGDAVAQVNLGVMYDTGRGVAQNYAEAVRWYRLAAAQGNAAAQVNLGTSYATGEGVGRDYSRAYLWLSLAAAASEFDDEASRLETRDALAGRLSAAQRVRVLAQAARCKASGFKECGEPRR
jgi:hypothetical protein